MKYLKTYKQLNEGLRDKLVGKSDDEIRGVLMKKSLDDWFEFIRYYKLGDEFKPTDDEIRQKLEELRIDRWIDKYNKFELDEKFYPTDDEIRQKLEELSIDKKLFIIKEFELDEKFYPTDKEIKQEFNKNKRVIIDLIKIGYNLDKLRNRDGIIKIKSHLGIYERIKKLPDDLHIGGDLICVRTYLDKLPSGLKVGGNAILKSNNFDELPKDLIVNGIVFIDDRMVAEHREKPEGVKLIMYTR